MLNLTLVAGSVFVEKEEKTPTSGVVSLIGLAGAWVGTGQPVLLGRAGLQDRFSLPDGRIRSGGRGRAGFSGGGDQHDHRQRENDAGESAGGMGLSTPTVIYGRNFQTRSTGNQEWTVVPFDC